MSDGRWETQVAVYQALISAGVGTAETIKAPAPENYEPPNAGDIWCSIEDGGDVADDAEGMTGLEERFVIHVWQRATSYKAIKQAISNVREALHDKSLTVEGRADAYSQVRSTNVETDPDGLHLHGIVEVIVLHHS